MGVALAALACVAHLPLKAVTTNDVDIAALALAANKSVVMVDGWVLSGLDKYNDTCVKFDTIDDYLESTNFPRAIVGLAVSVRCSSTSPTRSLYVYDDGARIATFPDCSAKDKLETRVFRFEESADVRKFTLKLEGSGQTGNWGIGGLSVIMADPVETPTGLCVLRPGATRVELAWTNSYTTVSNEMTITRFVATDAGETILFECGFDNFSAAGNPALCIDRLPPELSGELIYSPANTNGICQISSGSSLGVLVFDGLDDYSGVSLRLCMMRYPGDKSATEMKVRWTDGATTNLVKGIKPGDVFGDEEVSLGDVPGGVRILLGDSVKSDHRILIDTMAFVRTGSIREEEVGVKTFPAPSGSVGAGTMDVGFPRLAPETSYRVYLRAYNQEGDVSSGSVQVDFTTAKPIPSVFRLF